MSLIESRGTNTRLLSVKVKGVNMDTQGMKEWL